KQGKKPAAICGSATSFRGPSKLSMVPSFRVYLAQRAIQCARSCSTEVDGHISQNCAAAARLNPKYCLLRYAQFYKRSPSYKEICRRGWVVCEEVCMSEPARPMPPFVPPTSQGEFATAAEPHRRELQVHCYRMLGSLQDAEDLVQETFLRAWQRLETFEGRAPF